MKKYDIGIDVMNAKSRLAQHEKKMGRPIKAEEKKVKVIKGITFTIDEAKKINEFAEKQGLPVATFLRRVILFTLNLLKNEEGNNEKK